MAQKIGSNEEDCSGRVSTFSHCCGQEAGAEPHARFHGLDWIVLIVHGRGRAGHVVDLVALNEERSGNIMTHELEVWLV